MKTKKSLVSEVLALFVSAGWSCAEVITVSNVTYTGTASEQSGVPLDNEAHIIDGSGLNGSLAADESNIRKVAHRRVDLSRGNAWSTVDFGSTEGDWFAVGENDGSVSFEFHLGTSHVVDSVALWGYHFGVPNGNAISSMKLSFSTDGTGAVVDSSQTISIPLPSSVGLATVVDLTPTTANFIRMAVLDNHFGFGNGGDRVGVAEIAFTSVSQPEDGSDQEHR